MKKNNSRILLKTFPFDKSTSVWNFTNQQDDWVQELLNEIESLSGPNPDSIAKIDIEVSGQIDDTYGEVLFVTGQIHLEYQDICGKCAALCPQVLQIPLKVCFMNLKFAEKNELHEEIDIFINNDEYELYFYEGKEVEIAECVHENAFLYREPNPTHPDCKGLCLVCGINLNNESCSH